MIEIPRALARQFRAVLRRSLLDQDPRGPWPLILCRAGEGGLVLQACQGDLALRYQLEGARALRVADALETGMIWLNSENVRHLPTPFGGMKASGIGRDGGDYSFDFYMETKHVSLARGTHKIQKLGI